MYVNQPVLAYSVCVCVCMLLTLSLYFIRAPSPDNSPGLQLDLKCPSLRPLGLLRIKQRQYCAQLQVSVQVVHLRVVVHPRNRSVGKEARGPSHVHFPCLLSVSSQNNLLSPGLDRDTYSGRRGGGNPWNNNSSGTSSVSVLYTNYTAVRSWCCQGTHVSHKTLPYIWSTCLYSSRYAVNSAWENTDFDFSASKISFDYSHVHAQTFTLYKAVYFEKHSHPYFDMSVKRELE